MTLGEIEAILDERGLRLRRAVRFGSRCTVEVADVATGTSFEASGVDMGDAIANAVEAALRRPTRRTKRRYTS